MHQTVARPKNDQRLPPALNVVALATFSAALSGRALDPRRITMLRHQGTIAVDADGRLRVTTAGFPVLDAVVADLAA